MNDNIVGALKRAARFIEEHYTGIFTDDLRADAKALRDLAEDWEAEQRFRHDLSAAIVQMLDVLNKRGDEVAALHGEKTK